jgi:co-chaperonin GroES (HSP10)
MDPDTAKEKPVEGEIPLAVDPGARDETGRIIPLDVKVGDCVLFGKWPGTDVLIDGEERLILKEADVLRIPPGVLARPSMRLTRTWGSHGGATPSCVGLPRSGRTGSRRAHELLGQGTRSACRWRSHSRRGCRQHQ